MDRYTHETSPNINTPETTPLVLEYADVVDIVQLSVARCLSIQGSLAARSFRALMQTQPEQEKEHIICEIGAQFDEALINFVTASLMALQQRPLVILAEQSEGIDGHLPWQEKLEQRLQMCREKGVFRQSEVRVERFTRIEDEEAMLAPPPLVAPGTSLI